MRANSSLTSIKEANSLVNLFFENCQSVKTFNPTISETVTNHGMAENIVISPILVDRDETPAATLDFCQCCMKSLNNEDGEQIEFCIRIDEKFQKDFEEVIGYAIPDGTSCLQCYETIKDFVQFRADIRNKQKIRGEIVQIFSIEPSIFFSAPPINIKKESTNPIKTEPVTTEVSNEKMTPTSSRNIKKIVKTEAVKPIRKTKDNKRKKSVSKVCEFKCLYCPTWFTMGSSLTAHIKKNHCFECKECEVVFQYRAALVRHQVMKHSNPSVEQSTQLIKVLCSFCGLTFSSEKLLNEHLIMAHKENIYDTLPLDDKGDFAIELTRPENSKPAELPEKPLIKKSRQSVITRLLNPKAPEVLSENVNSIPCLDCGLVLSPDELYAHRIQTHIKLLNKSLYFCDLCGLKTIGKPYLIHHMKTKHLCANFERCEFCNGLYENRQHLISHQNRQHNFNGTRYGCHFCEQVFGSKDDMFEHRKYHYHEVGHKELLLRQFCKKFNSYEPLSEKYN